MRGTTFRIVIILFAAITLVPTSSHAAWSRWTNMGGTYTEDPALCTELFGGIRAHLVAKGVDNAIWWRQWSGRVWRNAESLGGDWSSSPGIACSNDQIDVFARGHDNNIYWNTYRHATQNWTGWRMITVGTMAGAPTAVWRAPNSITVFARHYDGTIRFTTSAFNNWSPWQSVGPGSFIGDPGAAIYHGPNSSYILLVARGADNHLYETGHTANDVFAPWRRTDRVITSSPELTFGVRSERRDYFARNPNNTLGHSWNGIHNWESLAGILASAPAAVWVTDNQLLTVIRGNDSALYYRVDNK